MRLLLAANPRSGEGVDRSALEDRMRAAGAEVEVLEGSITEMTDPPAPAQLAALERADRVVVAAGDGCVALGAALAARADRALGVIPTGTANDFARALELPEEVATACELVADPTARVDRVDLARIGGRPWVNAASIGLSPEAAEAARGLKDRLGALAYPLGALRAGLTTRKLPMRVLCDGREAFAGHAWQLTLANTGAFGGGAEVGDAESEDGLLDVVVLTGSRAALAVHAWRLRRGTTAGRRGTVGARAREVEVHAPPGTPWNVDGEVIELEPPVVARVERRAFGLVVA